MFEGKNITAALFVLMLAPLASQATTRWTCSKNSYTYCFASQSYDATCGPLYDSACKVITTNPLPSGCDKIQNSNCSSGGSTTTTTTTSNWSCNYLTNPTPPKTYKKMCIKQSNLSFCGGTAYDSSCSWKDNAPAGCSSATLIACGSGGSTTLDATITDMPPAVIPPGGAVVSLPPDISDIPETVVPPPPSVTIIKAKTELLEAEKELNNLQTSLIDLSQQHKATVEANKSNPGGSNANLSSLMQGFGMSSELAKKFSSASGESGGISSREEFEIAQALAKSKQGAEKKKNLKELSSQSDAEKSNKVGDSSASKNSSDPWVAFMAGGSSKEYLVEQLRKDPELRKKLAKALAEKRKKSGDKAGKSAENLAFIEEVLALAEARANETDSDSLEPLSKAEAFSMDSEETENSVRRMLAELDSEDPQFLANGTLFERVKLAHHRTAERGFLKKK